jgi:hypothetical protein
MKVGQVFVDGPSADRADIFLGEHLGAELASSVAVGVSRVAHGSSGGQAGVLPRFERLEHGGSHAVCGIDHNVSVDTHLRGWFSHCLVRAWRLVFDQGAQVFEGVYLNAGFVERIPASASGVGGAGVPR